MLISIKLLAVGCSLLAARPGARPGARSEERGATRSLAPFVVQVDREIRGRDCVLDAVCGNVDLRDPQQRVQHDLALTHIAPVGVGMTARESETSAAVRPL